MQNWKKGLVISLFSSMLWEQQAVAATIGLAHTAQATAPHALVTLPTPAAEQVFGRSTYTANNWLVPGTKALPTRSDADLSRTFGKYIPKSQTRQQNIAEVTSLRVLLETKKAAEQEAAQKRAAEQAAESAVAVQEAPAQEIEVNAPAAKLASRGTPLPPPTLKSKRTGSTSVSNVAPTLLNGAGVASTRGNRAVTLALQYQGVPYRYGGTTPQGFDCSGFIQFIMQQVGVGLPRTTYQQYGAGTPISADSLRPGDIVFFSCGGQATSHSGLYIGNGRFVHADQDRGIAIAELSNSYWSNVFQGGVRVL